MTQRNFSADTAHETNNEDHFTEDTTHAEPTIHPDQEHANSETIHKENVMKDNLKNVAAVVFAIITSIFLTASTGRAFTPNTSTNQTFSNNGTTFEQTGTQFVTEPNFTLTDSSFFNPTVSRTNYSFIDTPGATFTLGKTNDTSFTTITRTTFDESSDLTSNNTVRFSESLITTRNLCYSNTQLSDTFCNCGTESTNDCIPETLDTPSFF